MVDPLAAILPLVAWETSIQNFPQNVFYGIIHPRYRCRWQGRTLTMEDYVNVNCHGVSLWHVDAADRIWPLPTEQRDAATYRALERISSQLSAVVRPFHYIINRHQLKPAKYKENGTLYSDVFVYGGLPIQVVNVQGVPDWRVRHTT